MCSAEGMEEKVFFFVFSISNLMYLSFVLVQLYLFVYFVLSGLMLRASVHNKESVFVIEMVTI